MNKILECGGGLVKSWSFLLKGSLGWMINGNIGARMSGRLSGIMVKWGVGIGSGKKRRINNMSGDKGDKICLWRLSM
ncbi:hypothetical protein, partial [Staphylococcus pettenkoferi]|uniref:hypothetical protein n=1 Tax=Staphylococcus pettenkoferi TaxID=170573 RepID=UPI001C92CFA4